MKWFLLIFFIPVPTASVKYHQKLLKNFKISQQCHKQLTNVFDDLSTDKPSWSQTMLDSTSSVARGPTTIQFDDPGDFNQCIRIKTKDILGKYCVGLIEYQNTTSVQTLSSMSHPIWALCLPSGCSDSDMIAVGDLVLDYLLDGTGLEVTLFSPLCQTVEDVYPKLTVGAILTIVLLLFLLILVVLSTVLDLRQKSFLPIFKAFSFYTNYKKVFKMTSINSNHISCLDGIRTMSSIWIMTRHHYNLPLYNLYKWTDDLKIWLANPLSAFIFNGALPVNTFFVLSGTLVSYGFMNARSKNISFNLFKYYIHRYIRVMSPYVLLVLVSTTLTNYMGSGPGWPMIQYFWQKPCQNYWWSALLCVQNFVNPSSMCVLHSWYIMVDMQFYFLSPIVLYGLLKKPKLTMVLLTLVCFISIGLNFYIIWTTKLPAIMIGGLSFSFATDTVDYYNKNYNPIRQINPWIIGVILGYYLFKFKQNVTPVLNRPVTSFLLVLSLGILLATIFFTHALFPNRDYNVWAHAFYGALSRTIWGLGVAGVILTCSTNHKGVVNRILSCPIFQVLGKFTYSVYLNHHYFLYVYTFSGSKIFIFDKLNLAHTFWGTFWFAAGFAALLLFGVELPMLVLEKHLL